MVIFVLGGTEAFVEIFSPAIEYCSVPCTSLSVAFSNSADTFIVAGTCFPSTNLLPGTSVITCTFCTLTAPVLSIVTLSQIPVLRSLTGCIQSHPATYWCETFFAIVPSPPCPPLGSPTGSGG